MLINTTKTFKLLHFIRNFNRIYPLQGAEGNPSTIQTACWYLDSILGIVHVQLDKLQLTAAACYWIAQKFHGPVTPASKLVKCANKAFTADKLLSAEKAILKKMVRTYAILNYLGNLVNRPFYAYIINAKETLSVSHAFMAKPLLRFQ